MSLPAGDRKLIQIVDAALADTARRSGDWLVCKPGCTQCCVGVFAINQLDALRLRRGLEELDIIHPSLAWEVRRRAAESMARLAADFPGDAVTGVLSEEPAALARFEGFGNQEPCPALDPETGLCDVYAARPMLCRVFGPPVRSENGLGVCELCYHGASNEQIAACELQPDPDGVEAKLLNELEARGLRGQTIVAFALGMSF